jgi:hypothetical protein
VGPIYFAPSIPLNAGPHFGKLEEIFCEVIKVDGHVKVPQPGCARSVHPGVGVVPSGFTPLGGGGVAIPRLAKRLEEIFCEVINIDGQAKRPLNRMNA